MAAPINPTGVGVQGNYKVVWVETLTSLTSPSAAEINAGTSLDVSYYLYADGRVFLDGLSHRVYLSRNLRTASLTVSPFSSARC